MPDPDLTRRAAQSASTLLLLFAVLSFPANVDRLYYQGCIGNFLVSFLYHALQEPHVPSCPNRRKLTRLPSSTYEWPCSRPNERCTIRWCLQRLDRAFVCFICLYTGCRLRYGDGCQVLVVGMSLLVGFGGMILQSLAIGVALYLTLSVELDGLLPPTLQLVFLAAALLGPLCFGIMCRIGAWCIPHRWAWHSCCACLVYTGGVLNAQKGR
mmetsp:Transcript_33017/g.72412  ORF Transcript_33017/g.72412 Transcript_33017/m.72412 type:complete len:211 (+) Transcript_33017:312-944(+)